MTRDRYDEHHQEAVQRDAQEDAGDGRFPGQDEYGVDIGAVFIPENKSQRSGTPFLLN